MAHNASLKDARLNVVVPSELKKRLLELASGQGRKVSALVRESIEEKLGRMERELFEEKMREAYIDMAAENLDDVEDFKYSDSENL